jgi:hypothetical protein
VDFFLLGAVAISSTSCQGNAGGDELSIALDDMDNKDELAKSLDDSSTALDINNDKNDEDAHHTKGKRVELCSLKPTTNFMWKPFCDINSRTFTH